MKRILRVSWPQTISHQQIQDNTGVNRMSNEIRSWRWNWICHMRKDRDEHSVTASRRKTTWKRTVEDERETEECQSLMCLMAWRYSWFSWRHHFPKPKNINLCEVLVLSDVRTSKTLSFCNVWQGSSLCNRVRLNFQVCALRYINMADC